MEVFNTRMICTSMLVENTPVIVTGKLVEEPNVVLRKWCLAIFIVYSCYYSSVLVEYMVTNPPLVHWIMLVASAFYFAFWLPLCGQRSAEKGLHTPLALFSGCQGFLGCWHMMSLISMWMFISSIMSVCQACQPAFDAGNSTCFLDEQNDTAVVFYSDCRETHPTSREIVFSILFLSMTVVSCTAAVNARKYGKAKVAHVITVQAMVPSIRHNQPVAAVCPPEDEVSQA